MELALRFEGFRVDHAHAGGEALAMVERDEPDVVILDIELPDIDGWTLLGQLADSSRSAPVPVVVVSARAGADARTRVTELGGRAYLAKPCPAALLARTVRSVCTPDPGGASDRPVANPPEIS